MARKKPVPGKKYYTPDEANAALPLVRAIVRDIASLAPALFERRQWLERHEPAGNDPYSEELRQLRDDYDRDHDRMMEYVDELASLGIDLKDPQTGLLDFPCWMGNREVYLCWRLGEEEVGYWHEVHAGFAGRQQLKVKTTST
jgi:hypothetical protein